MKYELKVKLNSIVTTYPVRDLAHAVALSDALIATFEEAECPAHRTSLCIDGVETTAWKVNYLILDGGYEYDEEFYVASTTHDEAMSLAKAHIKGLWEDEDLGEDSGDDPFVWDGRMGEGGTLDGRMVKLSSIYPSIVGVE